MYESMPLDLAERRRQADRDAQGAGQIERLSMASLKNQIQRITARVFEYEGDTSDTKLLRNVVRWWTIAKQGQARESRQVPDTALFGC